MVHILDRPERRARVESESSAAAPTEAALAATSDLDCRSTAEILAAIHAEDRRAVDAVGAVLPALACAADALTDVLAGGGRWFNVGAGTSGRLGCLDAAEIPPTFGFAHDRIEGLIAGGPAALMRAREGAEDNAESARTALRARELGPRDAVVAISASGRTPYALAGLEVAYQVGARRIAITCDSDSPLARAAEIAIAPDTGPEVIAGSTRMKGGLVQKMILHSLSTAVMVRLGRVEGNRMTHLRPGSRKLWQRALVLLQELSGADEATTLDALERACGDVAEALAMLRAQHRAALPLRRPGTRSDR
ncbi:MAG: murQ [Deltaproteobacteria bacterium]|nr:murQ [Deltaproteobacteria bacterium]